MSPAIARFLPYDLQVGPRSNVDKDREMQSMVACGWIAGGDAMPETWLGHGEECWCGRMRQVMRPMANVSPRCEGLTYPKPAGLDSASSAVNPDHIRFKLIHYHIAVKGLFGNYSARGQIVPGFWLVGRLR